MVPDADDNAFLHSGGTVTVTGAASVSGVSMITNVLNADAGIYITIFSTLVKSQPGIRRNLIVARIDRRTADVGRVRACRPTVVL